MDYKEAKKAVFATGTIPDGYFGETAHVGFALHPNGHVLAVTEHGFFTYHIPVVLDEAEAMFLLERHPSSRAKDIRHI